MMDIRGILKTLRDVSVLLKKDMITVQSEEDLRDLIEEGDNDEDVAVNIEILDEKVIRVLPWRSFGRFPDYHAVSIDGSSRLVRSRSSNLGIASVAIFFTKHNFIIDYPPTISRIGKENVYKLLRTAPIIGLQTKIKMREDAKIELERKISHAKLIRVRSFNNEDFYDYNYNVWQMVDEIRLNLENTALSSLMDNNLFSLNDIEKQIIVIDGAIYPTPRISFRRDGPEKYKRAYRTLIRKRIEILKRADELGYRVIGCVKRISDSYKLYRDETINRIARGILGVRRGRIQRIPDDTLLHIIIVEAIRKGILPRLGFPVLIGPIKFRIVDAEFQRSIGIDPPTKYIYYMWIPLSPYSPFVANVFRIEMLEKTFRRLGENFAIMLLKFGIDILRGIPHIINIPDIISRRASATYFLAIARLLSEFFELTYETKLEMEEVLREFRGERLEGG